MRTKKKETTLLCQIVDIKDNEPPSMAQWAYFIKNNVKRYSPNAPEELRFEYYDRTPTKVSLYGDDEMDPTGVEMQWKIPDNDHSPPYAKYNCPQCKKEIFKPETTIENIPSVFTCDCGLYICPLDWGGIPFKFPSQRDYDERLRLMQAKALVSPNDGKSPI